jgi:hypothetical protein
MKTKFNDFLLEYVKNETQVIYLFKEILLQLSKYFYFEENLTNSYFGKHLDISNINLDKSKQILYYQYIKYDVLTCLNLNNDDYKFTDDDIKFINKILNKISIEANKLDYILSYKISKNDIDIYIKNIITKLITPPEFLYHTTDKENLDSILKYGLLPRNYKESDYKNDPIIAYPNTIFLSDDKHIFSFKPIILKIYTKNLKNKFYIDINEEKG